MAEIINLNRYRKTKRREEQATQAAFNRVRHGRAKAEKEAERRERERVAADLDGKKVDDPA